MITIVFVRVYIVYVCRMMSPREKNKLKKKQAILGTKTEVFSVENHRTTAKSKREKRVGILAPDAVCVRAPLSI